MIKKLNENDLETVESLLKLQQESYLIEATLLKFYDLPPLRDTVESIQESNEIFYGYFKNDELVGIISYKKIGSVIDIHRVAVDPDYFNLGIASQLIDILETVENDAHRIRVCTGTLNKPAVCLYRKKGFREIKTISREISLTLFEKELKNQ